MPSNTTGGSSQAMDERIVAAKFDSSDFEKGVDKTVKKLDELKESLNLKSSGESITELGNKTSEAAKSMNENVSKLTDRVTTFTGMLKQKLLSGIADEVVGVFFKMENAVKGFFKSMTTDQIGAGMDKFEQMLSSVRLVTNSIKDSTTGEHYSQDEAYEQLEKLQIYSDETSYSMTQMSDALSKMVAAGVDLETATKSVQGIANACAAAGINATDASRAFFNLSQAYSSGSLKYTDYRSLELLNMTNENFQNQILEAGVKTGTLKKNKDGSYTTQKTDKNKKVTAGKKVTRKNLAESLKYNFLDTETMNQLFGSQFYFSADEYRDLRDKYLDEFLDEGNMSKTEARRKASAQALDELREKYGEVATNAFTAAREARNFNDVLNAIKDYISSSWSHVFETLFGQLDEASKFFTSLSEGGIANFFYDLVDTVVEIADAFNEGGFGGKAFRETILEIDEAIGELLSVFIDLIPDTQDLGWELRVLASDALASARTFKDWTVEFRNWMNAMDSSSGMTRIQKIQKIVGNLTSIFDTAGKVIGIALNGIHLALAALGKDGSIFDALGTGLMSLTQPIQDLNENESVFDVLRNSMANLSLVLEKVAENIAPVITLLGKVGGFFLSMTIDSATSSLQFFADILRVITELFTGRSGQSMENGKTLIEEISAAFESIKKTCTDALTTVKEFFSTLINDVRMLFGLEPTDGSEPVDSEGGVFSGLKYFFETNSFIQSAKAWLDQAKSDIRDWFANLPQTISDFFDSLFYETREVSGHENGKKITEEVRIAMPFKEWLDSVIYEIQDFITHLPEKALEFAGKIKTAITSFFENLFYDTREVSGHVNGEKTTTTIKVATPLKDWLDNTVEEVKQFLKDLPRITKEWAQKVKTSIQTFIHSLFYETREVSGHEDGKKVKKQVEVSTPLKDWIDSMIEGAKNFILNLPTYIKEAIKKVGSMGRIIVGIVQGLFKHEDVEKAAEDEADKISITKVLETIKDLGKEILNQILSWFTGTEDIEENFAWFGEQIKSFLESIPGIINDAVTWVVKQLVGFWDKIYSAITGTDKDGKSPTSEGSALKKKMDEITGNGDTSLKTWIKNIPGILDKAIDDIGTEIGALWDKLIGILAGEEAEEQIEGESESKTETLGATIGTAIRGVFEKIPVWVTEGIYTAIDGINTAFAKITEAMSKLLGTDAENMTEEMTESISEGVEETGDKGPTDLALALTKLGGSISDLISKTLPTFISTGFTLISTKYKEEWMPSLRSIFDGVNNDPDLIANIQSIGDSIVKWIKELPAKITEAWNWVKKNISKLFTKDEAWKGADPNRNKGIMEQFIKSQVGPIDSKKALDETAEDVEENADQSTLWDTLVSIAGDIGGALEEAFNAVAPSVIGVFAKIPTWIATGIQTAIDGISDVIGKASDWLKSDNIAEEVAEAVGEDVKEQEGDTEKEPTLLDAIKGIGQSIWKLIGTTIPEFIGSGFTYVKDHWRDWIDGLKTIFANVTGMDAGEINTETIKNKIVEALKQLPGKIKAAWEDAKATISAIFAKPASKRGASNKKSAVDELVNSQIESRDPKAFMDEAAKEVKEGAEQSDFWTTITELGTSIGETIQTAIGWAVENIGPFIVKGWNSTLDTISKLLTAIGNWFSGGDLGEEIDQSFDGETGDFKKTLTNIGQTIEKLFVETIPIFIGSAIGKIITVLPDLWHNLFVGLNESMDAAAEEEKKTGDQTESVTEGAEEAVSTVGDFIDNLQKNIFAGTLTTGAAIVAGLLVIIKIFETIKELINTFNISGNLAERTEAKNSIEAVFKRMLTALIAGMALVVYASQLDDDKFEKAKTILDMVSGLFIALGTMYDAAKLFDTVSGWSPANKLQKSGEDISKATGWFSNIADQVSQGFGKGSKIALVSGGVAAATDMIGSSISDILSQLFGDFSQLGQTVNSFAESIGKAMEDFGSIESNIDSAISLLNKIKEEFLPEISGMIEYQEPVNTANLMFGELTGSLGLFAKQFEGDIHAAEIIQAIKDIMGMTQEMDEFVKFTQEGDTFDRFKYALSSLGSALSFYNSVQGGTVSTDGIKNAKDILKAIIGDGELMGLADELVSNGFVDDTEALQTTAEQLIIFANALGQLGTAVSSFSTKNIRAFKDLLMDLQGEFTVTDQLGDADPVTITFSQRMHTLGEGLSSFAESIKDLDEDSVKTAGYALDMLATIAERAKYFGHAVLTGWISGSESLGEFALDIGTIGQKLRDFLRNITLDDDGNEITYKIETVKTAMFALQQLSSAASRLNQSNSNAVITLLQNNGELGNAIARFMSSLLYFYDNNQAQKINTDNFNFDYIKNILAAFKDFSDSISVFDKSYNIKASFEALESTEYGLVPLAKKIMEMFVTISEDMAEAVASGSIDMNSVHDVVDTINSLFDAIGTMHIFNLVGTGYEVFDGRRAVESVMDAIEIIIDDIDLMEKFFNKMDNFTGRWNVSEITDIVNVIKILGEALQYFGTENTSGISFATDGLLNLQTLDAGLLTDGINNIFTALQTFVEDPKNADLIKSSGTSMAQLLFTGIQEAFSAEDTTLKPEITPVLNMDAIKQQLADFFGAESSDKIEFNMGSIFTESLRSLFENKEQPTPIDYTASINSLKDSVDQMKADINSLTADASSINVYIDKERLVGEIAPDIDARLALFSILHGRHNST